MTSRSRVLQVIPSLVGGGAERQLVALCAALIRARLEVHLAYLHGGPNLEPAQQAGAVLHAIPTTGNHDPRALWHLRAVIGRVRPVLVQTWLLHADVFGGLAARTSGVPWLLSERSSAAMYSDGLKFRLRRRWGLHADAIVANSDGGLAYWRGQGYRGRASVIRNIVQLPTPASASERPQDKGPPVIVAVGRLSEEKNYPLLLDALEQLFSRQSGITAQILGEGPQRLALEQRIASSPHLAGRVQLPGYVDNVAQRLANASAYVSLSRFEGTPNTVLEAIAQSCPLVLSDIAAHREWLTGDEALWVVPGDTASVAEALQARLAVPATAHAEPSAVQRLLHGWSADHIAAQYLAVYDTLTSGRLACASS